MKKEEVLKLIEEHNWVNPGAPTNYIFCYPFMMGFMGMKKHYKEYYKQVFLGMKKGIGYQYTEAKKNYKTVKQLFDNPGKTGKIMTGWFRQLEEFYENGEKITKGLESLEDKELFSRYVDYLESFIDIWAAPLAMDGAGLYTEQNLMQEFRKQVSKEKWYLFSKICSPVYISFVGKEHLSLLKLALLYKRKSPLFEKELEEHQKSFFWIENNYRRAKILDKAYFLKKVKKEAERDATQIEKDIKKLLDIETLRKKQDMVKELKITDDLAQKILLTNKISIWSDKRKEMSMRGNHCVNEFLKELSKRMGITLEESLWTTVSETALFFKEGKNIQKDLVRDRMNFFVYMIEQPEKETLFTEKDAEEIIAAFEKEKKSESKEITGIVVSTGNKKSIRGRVRIVLDVENADFKEGEILVASMTRPEYVPLMKKAAAIITDEGGITSHASIASRELGIPCIIGTKIAKKVLKDGDIVEMDLVKGKVRKVR